MLQQLDTLIGFVVVMSVASLLITLITQMICSLLGLRGSNLADGLEAMLHKMDPALDAQARKELIDHVLTRPMLSDSMLSMSESAWDGIPLAGWLRKRWKRASAIRPEELLEALQEIAGATPVEAAARLAELSKAAPQPLPMKIAALRALSALCLPAPAANAASTAQTPRTQAAAPVASPNDADSIAEGNLKKWFNSAQNRAQQWFAVHARFWTITASIFMAFLLQLDTFQLIARLSNDPSDRARLIQFSQAALQKKADEVFGNTLSATAIYREAIDRLKTDTNVAGIAGIQPVPPDLKFGTQAAAESWLEDQARASHLDTGEVLAAFRSAVQTVTVENYNRAGGDFARLTDAFAQTGVELMPEPYPRVFAEGWTFWSWPWKWHWSGEWSWPPGHLFGIMATAALLSLGAPFWFNLLKSLANLRPLLADQIEQDKQLKPNAQTGG
ncbi:MAG: hypothetical protein KGR98_00320 [Verrucomicrobia bacterium]|nr:hypothetical protein [Verrucomicrobiota bacterium]MDE3100343.1 hypothetical protein [Verrucomicrobiota bacterium]